MKNTLKILDFSKQIQKLNLSIKEEKIFNKSQKNKLFIYVKGLKIFYNLNLQFISNWKNISKNIFNIILPKNEQIIKKVNNKKILLLDKMQDKIQIKNNNNNNFKDNLIKYPNLFIKYLLLEKKNQEIKFAFDKNILIKKIEEIKNENNLNNKNILDNNKLIKTNNINILNKNFIIKDKLINKNTLEIINSNILKSIFEWYSDKNKYINLLNILKELPYKLSPYNLLIENKIEREKLDLSQSSNNLNNFNLLFKGQPLLDSISKDSINKKSTREYINSITKFDSNNAYSYSNNYNYKFFVNNNKIPKNIYTFLEYSFLSLSYLISKPFFEITSEKVVIHLFYFQIKPKKKIIFYKDNTNQLVKKIIYFKDNISILTKKINRIKLYIISKILRKFFKKSVELEIVRLHYPYHNTNIFVNLLGKMVNKINLRRILRRFFNNAKIFNPTKMITNKISKIPSFISGVKIKIAGRLLTQRVIPRKTVKTISKGSLARGKVIYLEKSRFTNKNKRGAFSITVTTGHIT